MSNSIVDHIIRYRQDPLSFIREIIGVEPTHQQKQIIQNLIEHRFVACRSGNRIGKTSVASWLILWFMCCFRDVRVPCTSPSYAQLFNGIWSETQKWHRNLLPYFKDNFELTSEALYHRDYERTWRAYIKTGTKENPEVLAGAHSSNILIIADEGSGIPTEVIESISPSLGSQNAYFLMLGNPLRANGFFYDIFNGKHSIFNKLLKFSSEDSPLMSKELIESWEKSYGRDSNFFRIRVLGDFPTADDDQLIPLYALDDAKNRTLNKDEYKDADIIWGIDVGLDHDASVVVKRQGRKIIDIVKYKKARDSVRLSGLIKNLYEKDKIKPQTMNIDEIGIGRGTVDILRGWGLPVYGINVGVSPLEKARFANKKAELWHMCRDWFMLEKPQIPDDEDLIMDLAATKHQTNPSGKIKIESKEQIKKRIGRSTDTADALVLSFVKRPTYTVMDGE